MSIPEPIKAAADYLADRILEQGSMSAYVAAIIAAWSDDLPLAARIAILAAATYKFMAPG